MSRRHGLMQRACPPTQQPARPPAGSTWSPSLPGLPGGRVVRPPVETPPRPPGIAGPMAKPKLQLGGPWSSRPPGEISVICCSQLYVACTMMLHLTHQVIACLKQKENSLSEAHGAEAFTHKPHSQMSAQQLIGLLLRI